MRFVSSPLLRRLDRDSGDERVTSLADRSSFLEIEGDSLMLVRAVLDALRTPADEDELGARVPGFDGEAVLGALGFLREHGFVVAAPAEPRVAQAARRGVRVVGEGPVAAAIKSALAGAGLPVDADAGGSVEAGAVVVSVSTALTDPRAVGVDQACRAAGALHVPVMLDGGAAHIGPLTAPFVAAGPCARCALLRLLAVRPPPHFYLWREAVERGGHPPAGSEDVTSADAVAAHVVAFLAAVADDGSLGGKKHALVRVDKSGLADAHRVRRHGHCAACATPPPSLSALPAGALDAAAKKTEERWRAHLADESEGLPPTQPLVADFADPVTGLIQLAEEWSQRGAYFRRFPVLWGGVNLAREKEWVTTELQGINGTGPTVDHRRLVCVSEGAERYGQYAHRPAVVGAPYRALSGHALDPRKLVLYTDDRYAEPGFPRLRFDEERPLWWSWGYGLTSGKARLLPSELVAVVVTDETYPERIVDQMLTSGAASHTSWHKALLNGMRELVERDAHMIAWYKRIPLRKIDVGEKTGDAYADDLLAFLREVGVELSVLDLRLDFPIPTYLMVARLKETVGSWQAGGAAFVAVADVDPLAALSRGLCETALHYETLCLTPHASKEWRNNPYDPSDPQQGWRGWWPTYMHYLNPANVENAAFLWSLEESVPFSSIRSYAAGSPKRDVERFVEMFAERGLEPYAFDLVTDEIADLGFKVAKVVVPGLVDLTPGMQSRRLKSPRVDAIAKKLGRGLPPGELNRDPHPNA